MIMPYLFVLGLYACFTYDIMYFRTAIEKIIFEFVKIPPPEYAIVDGAYFRTHMFMPKVVGFCTERGNGYVCYK